MNHPRVFISYSHDSEDHKKWVLGLAQRLRQDGLDAWLDRFVKGQPAQGWDRWMLDELDAAAFVLVVCTPTYYRRFRGHEKPEVGHGGVWEGGIIIDDLYHRGSRTSKYVPVLRRPEDRASIPEPLRRYTFYALTSENNYGALRDHLLERAGTKPWPLPLDPLEPGPAPPVPPLTFDPKDTGIGPNGQHPSPNPIVTRQSALDVWREKLEFLLIEEAKAVDAAAKFQIRKQIEEAQAKIQELEGTRPTPALPPQEPEPFPEPTPPTPLPKPTRRQDEFGRIWLAIKANKLILADGSVLEVRKDYDIMKKPVTFREFDDYCRITGRCPKDDFLRKKGQHPVVNVSALEVLEFARWLSTRTGVRHRLPTADEWEFAGRAGATGEYCFGDAITRRQACFGGSDRTGTVPVGSYPANEWGLYDVHGNVWEWTMAHGQGDQAITPNNTLLELRGGSWMDDETWLGFSKRQEQPAGKSSGSIGFRLVREVT